MSCTALSQATLSSAAHRDYTLQPLEYRVTVKSSGGFRYRDGYRYNLQYLGSNENLEVTHLLALCIDRQNQLWMGGIDGEVVRFDGSSFYSYVLPPLQSQRIMKIACDHQGRIWIGSYGQGITIIDGPGAYQLTCPQWPAMQSLHVLDMVNDKEAMWICGDGEGLLRVTENTIEVFDKTSGLRDNRVSAVVLSQGAPLAVGYSSYGVDLRLHDQWRNYSKDILPDSSVSALLMSRRGQLWAATKRGLALWNESTLSFESIPEMKAKAVWDLAEDQRGRLWLATNGQGAFRQNADGTWTNFNQGNGLQTNRLIDVETDDDGNVWLGTFGSGLARHAEDVFINFTTANGLQHNKAWSICALTDGTVYCGHADGGISEIKNGLAKPFSGVPEVAKAEVLDLYADREGSLWIAAGATGVWKYKQGRKQKYDYSAQVSRKQVTSIAQAPDGKMFFTSWAGLMHLNEHQQVGPACESVRGEVWGQCFDAQGNHWLAARKGIYCLPAGSDIKDGWLLLDSIAGHRWKEALCITATENGLIWFGTDGGGLVCFDGRVQLQSGDKKILQKALIIEEGPLLRSAYISAVFAAPDGSMWAGTKNAITRLQWNIRKPDFSQAPEKQLTARHYTQSSGLLNTEVTYNNVAQDADGRLWWCTTGGVAVYDGTLDVPDSLLTPPTLAGIQLFFQDIPWRQPQNDERIKIKSSYLASLWYNYICYSGLEGWYALPVEPVFSHDQNHLTFQFSCAEWFNEEQLVYRVQLTGFDQEWIELGSEHRITYSALPPGHYVLRYATSRKDSGGLQSPVQTYTFEVMPPFWLTRWFMVLMAVLAILALYLIYKWRVRVLEKEKRVLEVKVSERTEELRKEKNKSDALLLNILPKETAEELKEKGQAEARQCPSATVLFTDFNHFATLTRHMPPDQLVARLNQYFKAFDETGERYGVEKIKTIGDAYMCATGLHSHESNHAVAMVAYGLQLLQLVEKLNKTYPPAETWQIRIGIHTGPVVTGVVGTKKFQFDVWGDTVNTASRMESHGQPGQLNISGSTARLVNYFFELESRGQMQVKSIGETEMFFVKGFKQAFASNASYQQPNDNFFKRLEDTRVN